MISKIDNNSAQLIDMLKQTTHIPENIEQSTAIDEVILGDIQATLTQFSDQDVDKLLKQQLAGDIVISKGMQSFYNEYTTEELAVRTIVSNHQEGLKNNENTDQLMSRLDDSAANFRTAYTNTSSILSSLGQLGPDQKSFLASSEQRVERAMSSYTEAIHRHFNGKENDGDKNVFEVQVKTQEGDIITISLHSAQGRDVETGENVDSFTLEYEVEGDLSKEEHDALTSILKGVGELADEFFSFNQISDNYQRNLAFQTNQAQLSLDFLSDFDNEQLASLDFSLSNSDGIKDPWMSNNLDFSYQFDQEKQEQEFSFNWEAGSRVTTFDLNMSALGNADQDQMLEYLAMMDENFEESSADGSQFFDNPYMRERYEEDLIAATTGFSMFKSAFSNMSSQAERYTNLESQAQKIFDEGRSLVADLTENMIKNDPRYQGLSEVEKGSFSEGFSNLADFDTKFSFSPGTKDSFTELEMSQETQKKQIGKYSGINQQKNIEANSSDYYGDKDVHHKDESYTITAGEKSGSLVGLDQEHTVNVVDQKYEYIVKEGFTGLQETSRTSEASKSESSIRLVEGIWQEKIDDTHIENEKKLSFEFNPEYATNENVDKYTPVVDEVQKVKHTQLVRIIGDLTALNKDDKLANKYTEKLIAANNFMSSINTKA